MSETLDSFDPSICTCICWWWACTCNFLVKNRRVWRHSIMSCWATGIRRTSVLVCIPQLWLLCATYAVQALCTGGPYNQEISTAIKPRIATLFCCPLKILLSQCYTGSNHNIHTWMYDQKFNVNVPLCANWTLDYNWGCISVLQYLCFITVILISHCSHISLCAPVLLTVASLSPSSLYVEQYVHVGTYMYMYTVYPAIMCKWWRHTNHVST